MAIASAAQISPGDTAWMLVATALVLMMTPALGLFYAGLVRSKNALNTFMMSAGALGVATVCWAAVGYSLAFDKGNWFVGGLSLAFLSHVGFAPRTGTEIPQLLAALAAPLYAFLGTFAILKLLGLAMPLRAPAREQALGMDVVEHGEQAYTDGEGAILLSYEDAEPQAAEAWVAQP